MSCFKIAILTLLLFTSVKLKSQTSIEIKKVYHYTFEGTISPENISSFELRLAQLPLVIAAKVKYKSEKQMGELFIETAEKTKSYEGESGFNIVELKKLIQTFNLVPTELTISQP